MQKYLIFDKINRFSLFCLLQFQNCAIFAAMKTIRFTELYFDDAQRLAQYLAARDGEEIEMINGSSEFFPMPPKTKALPDMVNAFKVGRYEIAYISSKGGEQKYRNRNLHRVMIGEVIEETRRMHGVTLEQLEERTGIKARNLESIECGKYDVSIDILGNIGEALGCHLEFVED